MSLCKVLRTLEQQLKDYRQQIEELFKSHPDHGTGQSIVWDVRASRYAIEVLLNAPTGAENSICPGPGQLRLFPKY